MVAAAASHETHCESAKFLPKIEGIIIKAFVVIFFLDLFGGLGLKMSGKILCSFSFIICVFVGECLLVCHMI